MPLKGPLWQRPSDPVTPVDDPHLCHGALLHSFLSPCPVSHPSHLSSAATSRTTSGNKSPAAVMFTPSGNLFRIDQMPEHFHELYILSGYRHPRSSIRQCLCSMFELTNETVNIWTHLLPAVYFLWVMWRDWEELGLVRDPYGYPMLVYIITMCLFPTASCTAHIFNTMSERARHVCFFMDYWALSMYSLGAAVAYRAYAFPIILTNSWFMDWYVCIATFNALASCAMSCDTRFLPHGLQKKVFRISAFAVPYMFDVIPVTYRAFVGDAQEWEVGGLYSHIRQFIFAFLSAFLYTSHIPERLFPGKFDLIGHSHQIFHVVSVFGTHDQMLGMRADMLARRNLLKAQGVTDPSFSSSILLILVVAAINTIVVTLFARKLHRIIKLSPSQTDLSMLGMANGNHVMDSHSVANGNLDPMIDSSMINGSANHKSGSPTRVQPPTQAKKIE